MTKNKFLNFGDKITLIKPMGSLDVIGQQYEIGGITDDHIVIRDCKNRIALAAVDYNDFDTYFVKATSQHAWTDWGTILGKDGLTVDGYYRTNGKKVQVKRGKVKGEASCCPFDTFNLYAGIQIALFRCQIKALEKAMDTITYRQAQTVCVLALGETNIDTAHSALDFEHNESIYNKLLGERNTLKRELEEFVQKLYVKTTEVKKES